ncbi:MAG TPA: DUF4416 family protein [Nitrospiria bacterium]
MERPRQPEPVALFIGMISPDPPLFSEAGGVLQDHFGPLSFQSPIFNWNHSRYYEEEMGRPLWRHFLFFDRLIPPETLADVKRLTNGLENRWALGGAARKRRINLDPGYVDLPKVVLASTKDFSHRIYLGRGIFAETTLIFKGGEFTSLPYTYPEFRKPAFRLMFRNVRDILEKNRPAAGRPQRSGGLRA